MVERYLALALRLGRHADELVDSYYGPEELCRRIEAEDPHDPAALAEEADALLAELGDDPWLAAQVRSLGTSARKVAGERLPYAEEVELVYGIEPRWHDEQSFADAAAVLEEALPGTGDAPGALCGLVRADRDSARPPGTGGARRRRGAAAADARDRGPA